MAWLFKRYFWLVHLLFLAVSAFIVASTINAFVGYGLVKSFAEEPARKLPKLPREKKEAPNFAVINERNLFMAKREVISFVDVDPEESKKGPVGRWQDAVRGSGSLKLLGTAVFSDPRYSMATIVDGGKKAETYSINECPDAGSLENPFLDEPADIIKPTYSFVCNQLPNGGILKRIEETRVYYLNPGERRYEYLTIDDEKASVSQSSVAKPFSHDYGKGIKQTGPLSYEIDQEELNGALNNLSQIVTQARAVPAFEGDKAIGFKMLSIKPDSVFSRIGLQNGDIVTRINGYELNSPEKTLELYSKLKTGNQFNMDVISGGVKKTVTYTVSQ